MHDVNKLLKLFLNLELTMIISDSDNSQKEAMATFAGGCFWCMVPPFDAEPGVIETIVELHRWFDRKSDI